MNNPMDEYTDEQIEQWNKEDRFYPDEMFIAAEKEEANRKIKEKNLTHEEMLELAAAREEENKVITGKISEEDANKLLTLMEQKKALDIAKNIMEENKEAFQHLSAIERKELAEKGFEELTTNEKLQLALEEIDWIVIGGQDGEEFYNSITFLRKVLRSLRTLD